jgi:GT2 family glycosyltransferase
MTAPLSICIPSKSRQLEVLRCLDSIFDQSIEPREIVVVDQSDVPYELPKVGNLIHLYEPHLSGLAAAKNLGVQTCSEDIVLFLDDDIELLPNCLAHLTAAFKNPNAVAATCKIANEEQEVGWWTVYTRIFSRGFFNSEQYRPRRGIGFLRRLPGGATAIRRPVLLREPFDENLVAYSYGEDWELSCRLLDYGVLLLVPDARVIHHESQRNRYSESQMQRDRWDNFLYFYDKLGASRFPMNRFWKIWWALGESILWLKAGMGLPFWRRPADVAAHSLSLRRPPRTTQ